MFYPHIIPHTLLWATHPLPELVGNIATAVLIVFLAAAVRNYFLFQSLVPVCKSSHTTALPLYNRRKSHTVNLAYGREQKKHKKPACKSPIFLSYSASLYQSHLTKKSWQKMPMAFEIKMHKTISCFTEISNLIFLVKRIKQNTQYANLCLKTKCADATDQKF